MFTQALIQTSSELNRASLSKYRKYVHVHTHLYVDEYFKA